MYNIEIYGNILFSVVYCNPISTKYHGVHTFASMKGQTVFCWTLSAKLPNSSFQGLAVGPLNTLCRHLASWFLVIIGWGNSLVSWHQAITWTNVEMSSVGFCAIHYKAIGLEMFVEAITSAHQNITRLRLEPHPKTQWVNHVSTYIGGSIVIITTVPMYT